METLGDLLKEVIERPPLWIVAVVGALITAHIVSLIARVVLGHRRGPNGLVITIELLIVFVLMVLTFDKVYFQHVDGRHDVEWWDRPIAMIALLILFGFLSMVLYLLIPCFARGHHDEKKP